MRTIQALSILVLIGRTVSAETDPELSITVDSSKTRPVITLENSVFSAKIRTNVGGACGLEHAIRDLVIKNVGEDQVSQFLDACAQRGPLQKAAVVFDSDTVKTVRAEYENCTKDYNNNSATIEYSIFPYSQVIRIDYLKFPQDWANIVDNGTPGGRSEGGQYRFYGDREYAEKVRGFDLYPDSYWNTYDGGKYSNDPQNGGPLNYKGKMIMAVGNPYNGRGYGRVIPIYEENVSGGTTIVKLLWNNGFENFPSHASRPFTSWLFVFERGVDEAVLMGQAIADGDMLAGGFVSPNQDPSAIASADRVSGYSPLTVSFDGSRSADPDGSIEKFEWDFGDGNTAAGAQVSHTYYVAGAFTVKLAVTDDGFSRDSAFVRIETAWPENTWWSIRDTLNDQRIVENRFFQYSRGRVSGGSLSFRGIRDFINKESGEDHALIFEALGTGYAEYDCTPEEYTKVLDKGDYLEIHLTTGKTEKIERMYKDLPLLEIQYERMRASWVEDKIRVSGPGDRTAFVMYGMGDVVGMDRGRELWQMAEASCGHNFGDCFINANGAKVIDVTFKEHFIYGMINLDTGDGVGFVYPTKLSVHDWKVWWDETNLISIEFFPEGRTGTRYIFLVDGGREELIETGKMIVNSKLKGELPSLPGNASSPTCDFNGDGVISVSDVMDLLLYQRSNPGDLKADFNRDGKTNILDAVELLWAQIEGTCTDSL